MHRVNLPESSKDMNNYLDIIVRAASVYVFMLLAIRFFGKKELSQLSVADLVLVLLISNAVQNAMVGPDVSLQGGLLAALVLFVLNYLIKLLVFRSKKLRTFIEGEPVMLIYKGNIIEENLQAEKITRAELDAVMREHGVAAAKDVELAILETDGNISVLSRNLEGQSYHTRRGAVHPKHKKD